MGNYDSIDLAIEVLHDHLGFPRPAPHDRREPSRPCGTYQLRRSIQPYAGPFAVDNCDVGAKAAEHFNEVGIVATHVHRNHRRATRQLLFDFLAHANVAAVKLSSFTTTGAI